VVEGVVEAAVAKVVSVPELATAEGIPAVVDAATLMLVAAADLAGAGQTMGSGRWIWYYQVL
jgi:hypothetical protein